jgi:hypothetical protein
MFQRSVKWDGTERDDAELRRTLTLRPVVPVLAPTRIPFVCHLCEGDVADRNAKQDLLALGIGKLLRQSASFFCPSPPPSRVVDTMWHENSPP